MLMNLDLMPAHIALMAGLFADKRSTDSEAGNVALVRVSSRGSWTKKSSLHCCFKVLATQQFLTCGWSNNSAQFLPQKPSWSSTMPLSINLKKPRNLSTQQAQYSSSYHPILLISIPLKTHSDPSNLSVNSTTQKRSMHYCKIIINYGIECNDILHKIMRVYNE